MNTSGFDDVMGRRRGEHATHLLVVFERPLTSPERASAVRALRDVVGVAHLPVSAHDAQGIAADLPAHAAPLAGELEQALATASGVHCYALTRTPP